MTRYRLYGLDLVSDFPFTHPLPELTGEPAPGREVRFDYLRRGAPLPGEGADEPQVVYRSPERLSGGDRVLTAERAGERTILRFTGVASFSVARERIAARPEADGDPRLPAVVELRLLGPVLALRLEYSGVAALHAAAVVAAGGAVAFVSGNRGGKTTLATALMAAGAPLLTDDVLALEPPAQPSGGFLAHPGYPQVRLWPEDAGRLLGPGGGAFRGLPRAHPAHEKLRAPVAPEGLGRFETSPRPLTRIYLPERREGGPVEIRPLPPREALMALVRHSFLPRLVEAMGWGERRLELLARLAETVPVARLAYPGGAAHLETVRRAVVADAGA